MTRDKHEARGQQRPPAPRYDRFGFQKTVGSYLDSGRDSETYDWTRPWTKPREE